MEHSLAGQNIKHYFLKVEATIFIYYSRYNFFTYDGAEGHSQPNDKHVQVVAAAFL